MWITRPIASVCIVTTQRKKRHFSQAGSQSVRQAPFRINMWIARPESPVCIVTTQIERCACPSLYSLYSLYSLSTHAVIRRQAQGPASFGFRVLVLSTIHTMFDSKHGPAQFAAIDRSLYPTLPYLTYSLSTLHKQTDRQRGAGREATQTQRRA
jgi:hypothetical protein